MTELTKYSEYKNHLLNCPYRKYKCTNEKCGRIGPLKVIQKHISECDYIKRKCEYCGKDIFKKDLGPHENDVTCLKLWNEKLTSELDNLKKQYKSEKNEREELENKYNELTEQYNSEKNEREELEKKYNELKKEKEETDNDIKNIYDKNSKKNREIPAPENIKKNTKNTTTRKRIRSASRISLKNASEKAYEKKMKM